MSYNPISQRGRLTWKQKIANNYQWFKDNANQLDRQHHQIGYSYGDNLISEFRRMKVNYDLYNNKIDLRDFSYVCQPFGAVMGELPARMVNRDIVSSKIKAMLGMESKKPFIWAAVAVNPEATTRKEQKEAELIRTYVVNKIMQPIQEQIEQELLSQMEDREPTQEELIEIKNKIAEQVEAMTPDEVRRYMMRTHQDPAEVMATQLLNYTLKRLDMKTKFDIMFKHGLLSALGVMYVSVLNGQPVSWNVNSLRFSCQKSPDTYFIEDSENASVEYRMSPSEVVKYFGDELSKTQIDQIYERRNTTGSMNVEMWLESTDENFGSSIYDKNDVSSVRVLHTTWKALRKIGFLDYMDETGTLQTKMVDEEYELDTSIGDISIEWEWIPEVYETWKIDSDIYVNMRALPGQLKDIKNAWEAKLPYYGVIYDNVNSRRVSLMDRLKSYQYFYNIIMYRLELLLASDKGKKVLMNINMVPDNAQINFKKWQHVFESTPFAWFDPNEEGAGHIDAGSAAKVIDLSLVSDIEKYVNIAEYIRTQCGRSVGITDQMMGQIAPDEAVTNAQQSLVQSSFQIEPYFNLHQIAKRNILQALLECNKVAYSGRDAEKLSYVTDDMTQVLLEIDSELLDNSTYGIFVNNTLETEEVKEQIRQLAHAALQNQAIELSDVITVIRQDSIVEAEEILKVAEENKRKHQSQLQKEAHEQVKELKALERETMDIDHQHTLEQIVTREEERRKTVIVQQGLIGASFASASPHAGDERVEAFKDISREHMDFSIQEREMDLAEREQRFKEEIEREKLKIEKAKVELATKKTSTF